MPTTPLATDTVVHASMTDLETDPYALYARMRRAHPIAWVPETERLWLTTWDLCTEAGANDEVFGPTSDVHAMVYGLPNVMAMSGEEHLNARAPLDARFRPRAVKEYAETILRPTAVRYIESVRGRGSADLTGEVLELISSRAIGDVLGFDDVSDATLLRWSHGLSAYLVDLGRGDPTAAAHAELIKAELQELFDGAASLRTPTRHQRETGSGHRVGDHRCFDVALTEVRSLTWPMTGCQRGRAARSMRSSGRSAP